jgi:hypothetical protein
VKVEAVALSDASKAVSFPETVASGVDLIEWYYSQGFSDGLPVVPPTGEKIEAVVDILGGDPQYLECRIPPRWGCLTREVLAINMVMAGCLPEYAPVVRAAMLALADQAFNLTACRRPPTWRRLCSWLTDPSERALA